ncbi:hypothetical protein ABZT47_38460 [Sphaerisporangium sp. NPDC005289]|uniref:PGAP1-like alpha/beta domain-containing protein n=1 Tax=Sphaerisporangium sp. NPDC005289 TaxID=3155247 RepID=UPI0033BEECCC
MGLHALLPGLGGIEPYTRLAERVGQAVVHPAAVLEFAYDWRLPVRYNAALLAEAAHRHLADWRAHPAHQQARRHRPDPRGRTTGPAGPAGPGDPDARDRGRQGQLMLVAHSMGGLLARALTLIPGAVDDIRAVVTLGTPYRGSPLAATLIGAGHGAPLPLPRDGLRRLAATMPGVHDLLPSYRCVDTGDDAVALTPAQVADLGGDADLAVDAARLHALLDLAAELGPATDSPAAAAARTRLGVTAEQARGIIQSQAHLDAVTHVLTGIDQPTVQSLTIHQSSVHPHRHTFSVHPDGELVRDRHGRLVHRGRHGRWHRAPRLSPPAPRHAAGPAARRPGQNHRRHRLRLRSDHRRRSRPRRPARPRPRPRPGRPRHRGRRAALAAHPHRRPGRPHRRRLLDRGGDHGHIIDRPSPGRRGQMYAAQVELPRPGLYRIVADTPGSNPVTALILAIDPASLAGTHHTGHATPHTTNPPASRDR